MNGLLKNNFYATLSNVKVFSIVMLLLGIFVVAVDNKIPSLIIGYMLLGMIGYSVNAIASLRKECMTKWGKYKLTTPIRRSAIIKSYYISHVIWLCAGIIFVGIVVSLSILLHGFPFDKNMDILNLFVMGIGISLLMGAIFFPLFYLGGDERNEVFLVISLLLAVGIFMSLVSLMNVLFGPQMTTSQLLLSAVILLACALLAYVLSYPLTVSIFKCKEY